MVYKARNYEMFGALAGIRGSVSQRIPTRGLPDDVSPITAACSEEDKLCIGHSWATLEELLALVNEPFTEPAFNGVLDEMRRAAALGPVRAVFWFDR
jgi:hypothetical protein